MMAYDRNQMTKQLVLHEGIRLKPYKDSVGKLTIGIGRNLDDRGITLDEAYFLCHNNITEVEAECLTHFPWFKDLDPIRQRVIADMCFNLGIVRLKRFVNTLKMVEDGDYSGAARGMLNSLWARQVGVRAIRLSRMMDTGEDYTD